MGFISWHICIDIYAWQAIDANITVWIGRVVGNEKSCGVISNVYLLRDHCVKRIYTMYGGFRKSEYNVK